MYTTFKFPQPALILLPLLLAATGQHVFWVAPNATQCGDRTPCQTLDNYNEYNSSFFSKSHTKWIFLGGMHFLRSRITIENAVNVTLTGEQPCTNSSEFGQCSTIMSVVTCDSEENKLKDQGTDFESLYSTAYYTNWLEPWPCTLGSSPFFNTMTYRPVTYYKTMTAYLVTMVHCSDIVVNDLNIFYQPESNYQSCDFSLFKFKNVNNLALYSVTSEGFIHSGSSNSESESVLVVEPSGTLIVNNSHLESLAIEEPLCSHVLVVGSNFRRKGIKLLTYSDFWEEKGCACEVRIANCQFDYAGIKAHLYGTFRISLEVNKCLFQKSEHPFEILGETTNETLLSVNISDTYFIHNKGAYVVSLDLDDGINPFTKVTFYNVTFANNSGMEALGNCMITAKFVGFVPNHVPTPVVIFDSCKFQCNRLYHHEICLNGFPQLYPVQFKGHNVIQQNDGGGVYLNNSVLWVQGWLEIKDNGHNLSIVHSGLKISTSSQIWLNNNSQVHIVNNKGFGVFGTFQYGVDYLNPKPCFFSLVHDGDKRLGSLVGEDDNFSASLVISRNVLMLDSVTYETSVLGNQIYNAHLQTCIQKDETENKVSKEDEIEKYLKLDSWDEISIGSPPYNICLCDVTQPNNKDNWICNSHVFKRTVYPSLAVSIGVVTLGDLYLVQPAHITIATSEETRYYNKSITSCTELHTFTPRWSPSTHNFSIVARSLLKNEKMSMKTNVIIEVTSQCPPGMSIFQSNQTKECRCNQILTFHGFRCEIKPHGYHNIITYTPKRSHQWLGYWNGQLMVSDNCPLHYCSSENSSLLTTGITLEDLNTSVQCDPNSKRQGLLCSQCTTGTSSQFGSFRCAECNFAGLLMIPLQAIVGILLVVFLFLFNFTVLQGDVVGIAFYANIVCIMDEFLLKYAPRPFYGILALINVSSGFEVCFFDGMDEFTKAIIKFMFPSYLLSLVIIIIIAAHKYNLKIFRVRFVGRRSVPVLATIMLITYSGLINAVIYGLQYTTIYNVDSGKQQLVWLHQPELEYCKGKHIAVGILCLLVLLFYLLPLTIVTLFGDLFRMCSRNLWYSHFLDVFHGAFRYPFGFWFGTRLLFRMVFITLNITTNTPVVAYTIFLTTGAIILLQFLLEPFRTDNVTIYRPDPGRKVTRRDVMKEKISKIFRPKIIDSLFLFNIMFMTTAVLGSTDFSPVCAMIGVCLSISLALIQLVAIVVHHAYHYFPLPDSTPQRMEALRVRYINFRERMREKLRARRNRTNTPDIAPVQITYLSASMCFNSEEYTSSSSSSGEENDSEDNDIRENSTVV